MCSCRRLGLRQLHCTSIPVTSMERLVWRALRDDHAQDLIEYALLASFISVIAIQAIVNVGTGIANLWDLVLARMPDPS
jgi:Flp pilus assembly pilin Flp